MHSEEGQRKRDRSMRGDRPSRFSDGDSVVRSNHRDTVNKIFVSNIPYECRWTELKDFFRENVNEVLFVTLYNNKNGKPSGCASVELPNREAVSKACQIVPKIPLNNRLLVVKDDTGVERNEFGKKKGSMDDDNNIGRARDMGGVGGGSSLSQEQFNLYGLNAQFLDSLGIVGPLGNLVFVANLDFKVDPKKLKEIFKMAGKVRNIDLALDKNGTSRGFAVVEYDHPVEAVQAISMFDKQMLYERAMTVRMNRVASKESFLPEGLRTIGQGLGPNGEPLTNVASHIILQQSSGNQSNVQTLYGNGMGASGSLNMNRNNLGQNANVAMGLMGSANFNSQIMQQNDMGIMGNMGNMGNMGSMGNMGNMGNIGNMNNMGNMGNIGNMGNAGMVMNMQDHMALNQQNQNMLQNNYNNSGMMGNNSFNNRQEDQNNMGMGGMSQLQGSGMYSGMQGMSKQDNNRGGRDCDDDSVDKQSKMSDMVVVRNLPPSLGWQNLKDKFNKAGEVRFVEVIDKETALVRFQNEWIAERAIKLLDKTRVEGRTISVRPFEF